MLLFREGLAMMFSLCWALRAVLGQQRFLPTREAILYHCLCRGTGSNPFIWQLLLPQKEENRREAHAEMCPAFPIARPTCLCPWAGSGEPLGWGADGLRGGWQGGAAHQGWVRMGAPRQ